jgi:hypothetical protein
MAKANNRPLGEFSHSLITLVVIKQQRLPITSLYVLHLSSYDRVIKSHQRKNSQRNM